MTFPFPTFSPFVQAETGVVGLIVSSLDQATFAVTIDKFFNGVMNNLRSHDAGAAGFAPFSVSRVGGKYIYSAIGLSGGAKFFQVEGISDPFSAPVVEIATGNPPPIYILNGKAAIISAV